MNQAQRSVLMETERPVGVGDDGGVDPNTTSNQAPLKLIVPGI